MTATPILIVFDCDGTLVDSQHVIVEAMRQAFLGANLFAPDRSAILRTVGLSIPEALSSLAPEQDEEVRLELAAAYRERYGALRQLDDMREPMFAGAAPLLFELAGLDHIHLGIATGKSRRGVSRLIESNGLGKVFSTIQTADDAPSKPHPAMLLQAMADVGATPRSTLMIGDTTYDIIMAACAGVESLGVAWGYHSALELQKAGASQVVRSFYALSRLLKGRYGARAVYEAVA